MSATRPCRNCRAQVPETSRFCTECGTPTSFRPPSVQDAPIGQQQQGPPAGGPARPTPPSWSTSTNYGSTSRQQPVSGIGVVPPVDDPGMNGIALAHGEVVKRVYELGRIQRMWGWVQGTLIVTDTRVLYRAEAHNKLNRSTLNKEIHLKDVRGVGLTTRRGMSAAGLGAWLLGGFLSFFVVLFFSGALSMASSFNSYGGDSGTSFWLFLLILLWAAACITIFIIRRKASVVVLSIFSSDIEGSPISVTGVVGNSGGHGFLAMLAGPLILLLERLGIIEAGAAAESAEIESVRQVYGELGAVILDLQSRGALGAV